MLNLFSRHSKSKQNKPGNLLEGDVPLDAYKGHKPYIFISYAHADKSQVYEQINNLNANGYRIWYDEGIEPGKNFVDNIAQAIENCAYFIVFISPHSIASEYVNKEIHFALENKCPFLAVHLIQTNLPSGLKFSIGALQAILKHEIDEDRYWKKLVEILPETLMDKKAAKKRPNETKTDSIASPSMQPEPVEKTSDFDKPPETDTTQHDGELNTLDELLKQIKLKVDIAGELKADLNSLQVFNKIKTLDSEKSMTEAFSVMLISATKNREWVKSWIILTLLKYYKNTEQLEWALKLAKIDFKNKYHNLNVHRACLEYVVAVDSFRNKEQVRKAYMTMSETCISFQIRQQSIINLAQTATPDDAEVIEFLFSRIDHEKIVIQETVLSNLLKFNLKGFENHLMELMQHPETRLRLKLMENLANNPGKLSFSFDLLTELFEYEKHDIIKTRLARLLFLSHPEKSKSYFSQVFVYKEPLSVKAIFGGINFVKNTPGFAKEAGLDLLPHFNGNNEVVKAINNYLARLK